MADLDLMKKSIDYIEENLKADLSLADIADKAGFSPFHFCRMFQKAVGLPVMAYVLRRRLLHAAYRISLGMDAVLAALDYGFDTYAIHRDPNPANILMEGEELSGFIDFELGQRSIRLFDPCYLTTAILSETFPASGCPTDDKWFEVFSSVMQGYDTVCPSPRRNGMPFRTWYSPLK